MSPPYSEWNNKQIGALGRFHHDHGEHPYSRGCVLTPYGIVAVYYEPGSQRSKPYVNLDFIRDGRRISRTYRKQLTERGLVTVAHRFAAEITESA